jgi:transcription antitermination factor NusG
MNHVVDLLRSATDLDSVEDELPWYAIRVRSNFERIVARNLQDKGFNLFLPTYHERRRWSDRVKQVEVPLFPGYVFCRLNLENRIPVLNIPGVVQILGQGNRPVPVPTLEIDGIKAILKSDLPYLPWSSFVVGQRVVVDRGPLMGLQGVLIENRKPHRLVVSVTLLQRSVAVEVDASWVRPLPNDRVPDFGASARSTLVI